MTLFLDSAVPYGHDPLKQNPGDTEYIDPSLLELQYPYEMTKNNDAGYGYAAQPSLDLDWTLDVPLDDQSFPSTQYFAVPGSDATKSPGRSSQQQSSGRSENTGSPISQVVYTPSSTTHEYDAFVNDGSEGAFEDEDDSSKSPLSDSIFSNTTDSSFFLVNYPEGGESMPTERPSSHMDPRPQPATSRSSARPSRASSVAKSSTSHHGSSDQWDAILSVPRGVMSHNNNETPSGAFGDHDGFAFGADAFNAQDHQDLHYELMSDLNIPTNAASPNFRNVTQSSFRTFGDATQQQGFDDFAYTTGSTFNQSAPPSQQLREQQPYFAPQYQQSQNLFAQQQMLQHTAIPIANYVPQRLSATSPLATHQPLATRSNPAPMSQAANMPIRSPPTRIVVHQPQHLSSVRTAPYPNTYQHSANQVSTYQRAHQRRAANAPAVSITSTAPSRRVHLAPREDHRPHVVPSNAPVTTVPSGINRKGGRARHTHLPDDKRQQTSKMRGVTACWRCALQRDKCDDGEVCRRCTMRSQKGQRDLFGCDRSKLPEWIEELLPLSMTDCHSRPSIESYVVEQVARWNTSNSIDIYLTSGYGPPLMWRCCEFQPKDRELLGQLQYLQETSTGTEQRRVKYSPPFALEKLDESDDAHFQDYLDNQLMHPEALQTLGATFYGEECLVDPHCFQAQVLDQLCTLFTQTRDTQLRDALQDIIRMLIVTYIMGHTLTIAEDTLPTVLASVRYTPRQSQPEQHTSPRLANRQLKHYFSSLRHNTYLKVLHRQQQTFHDSKKKEAHWLVSFCAMLGLAMVLEEIQITIQIQADAKWIKGEMPQKAANAEALSHCQRIDGKFEKLVFYFQKKYRDRKWGEDGSFGHGTPNYRTVAESRFLANTYGMLLQRQDHLRSRESIPLGPQHQCRYTTRLVAKFLLPFLNLAS